ncbi:MAG: type II toxin-antitoxin system death-on-curing family toxin [Patescibacteria group bacterium]
MNSQYVEIDEVYEIHEAVIKKAGTKASVADFALLHSAVERPKATFQGQDLYPTIFTKAAALLQSLCLNHAFTDGNKRTSWLSTKRFLYINGYHLKARTKDAVGFMVMVDNEKPSVAKISSWLKKNSKKI